MNLKHVLDTIPHIVYWKNKDSIYQGCNRACADAWYLSSSDDVINKTDRDYHWHYQINAILQTDRQVMQNKKPHITEHVRKTIDGRERTFLTQHMPLVDSSGNICGIVGVSEDTTRSRQLLKQQFIRNQNHELRNLHMGIMTAAECLSKLVTGKEARELVSIIRESGQILFDEHMRLLDES